MILLSIYHFVFLCYIVPNGRMKVNNKFGRTLKETVITQPVTDRYMNPEPPNAKQKN